MQRLQVIEKKIGFKANLRRVISSPSFYSQFGELNLPDCFTPDDKIGAMVPIGTRRASGKEKFLLRIKTGLLMSV